MHRRHNMMLLTGNRYDELPRLLIVIELNLHTGIHGTTKTAARTCVRQ